MASARVFAASCLRGLSGASRFQLAVWLVLGLVFVLPIAILALAGAVVLVLLASVLVLARRVRVWLRGLMPRRDGRENVRVIKR